ncbi:copper resistance protein CopC [Paenibacillus harenae]|uniref:Copper export protein/methionine-rich copper-binding protein CopC n=1 Tax=Paenibacillus harenae TaxID=306543 RepID=A0ABT9TXB7_PAEHA|nr:copper resistance protein CopC [Paenibacillus harenae]MDQ0112025.1 putative copper export protein/methionine-rich copper-binding protein CopC [Paenibacillus harenae]
MIKRISLISITIWFMWACLPSFVSAHAYLSHSTPLQDAELQASPGAVKLTFTEKIDTKLSSVTLVKAGDGSSITGKLSADGDRTLIYTIPKLDNGEYKVVWQVLSLDTHITDGSFRFAVGGELTLTQPDETASLDGGGSDDSAAGGSVDSGVKPADTSRPTASAKPKPPAYGEPQPSAKPKPSGMSGKGDADDSDVSSTPPPSQGGTSVEGSEGVEAQEAGSTAEIETTLIPYEATTDAPTVNIEVEEQGKGNGDNSSTHGNSPETDAASEVEQEMLGSNADGEHNHAGDEHDHEGGQKLITALRIADVLVSAWLAALLFFRYCIWRDYATDAPSCFTQRAERVAMAVAVAVWLATGLWRLTMLSNDLGGIPLQQIATGTMVGKIAVLRPLAAALLLLLAFAPAREQRFANIVKAAAAACVIMTFPLTGHAYAELTVAGAAILAHAVHMGAAAIWLGGLAGLVSLTCSRHAATALKLTAERFSLWALPSMMLIVASGIWLSARRLSSWKQLVTEDYGNLIVIKSGLLLLVLVIAAVHRVVFMPRLAKAQEAGDAAKADESKRTAALRRLLIGVRVEILLAAALFVMAGMLSTTSPPSESASQAEGMPFYWHVMGEQAHMTLRIHEDNDSGSQKANLHVWLPEGSGPPEKIDVSIVPNSEREADSKQLPQAIPFKLQPPEADARSYPGFIKYTFDAVGAFIERSVDYVITVDIIDALDNDFHYERQTNS